MNLFFLLSSFLFFFNEGDTHKYVLHFVVE